MDKDIKICNNCKSELRNEAVYCDQCGHFLKFDNSLQLRYAQNKKIKKFEEIINFVMDAMEEKNNGFSTSLNNFDIYLYMIRDYFNELTNINKVLKNKNFSEDDFYLGLHRDLFEIKKNCEGDILNEFLYKMNEKLIRLTNHPFVTHHFIFYTNISRNFLENQYFNKILSFFNLSVFSFEEYIFDENYNAIKNKFKSNFVMFKATKCVRNKILNENDALNKVYSFFGFLTFIHNFLKQSKKWAINEFSLEFSEVDLEISSIIILNEDFTFNKKKGENLLILHSSNDLSESNILDFNNLSLEINIANMGNIEKNILTELNVCFKLYYLASHESSIENSFLKFWALTERIIKTICGNSNDDKLLKYMNKILKLYTDGKHFEERLDIIRKKRNNLVHKNINEITQFDRNLIKVVSEFFIHFIINISHRVKNMNEYQIILDNFNQGNLERKIDLMKFSKKLKKK